MNPKILAAVWLAASCLVVSPVFGALGERVADLTAPGITASDSRLYSIRSSLDGATKVREYLDAKGVVFAVAWQGIAHPDLAPLLGRYLGEYAEAETKTPRAHGRRRRSVSGSRVTVEHWGHQRALGGRAYVSSLIPNGVTVDEIR